jgi:hypothetical protein
MISIPWDLGRVEKEGPMLNRRFRWRADPLLEHCLDLDWNQLPFFELQNSMTGVR